MPDATCSFEGCDRRSLSLGLCQGHYSQQRVGKTLVPLRPKAKRGESLAWLHQSVLHSEEGCVEWPFGRISTGYGTLKFQGRTWLAHRLALSLVEPWHPPYGTFVLHSCDNPPCVNPSHLSWGTNAENMRQMAERGRGTTALSQTCQRGHKWTPENTKVDQNGGRRCRTCQNARRRLRRQLAGASVTNSSERG